MIALYPGTFDPITNGHIDLVKRGARLFDQLIVAVNEAGNKKTLFTAQERVVMAQSACKAFDNVTVIAFTGLLVDCVREHQAGVLVRGLRAVSDFEYEFQLASMNRRLDSDVETIFLTPSAENNFLSSTLVREIASLSGDVSSFVDPYTEAQLKTRFSNA